MNSNLTQYYTARVERLKLINRERRARRYLDKGHRQRMVAYAVDTINTVLVGSIIVLLVALVMK